MLLFACQPPVDNSAKEAFAKNSEVVMAYLDAWENESDNYADLFADDYLSIPTSFGSPDSLVLEEYLKNTMETWAAMDFQAPDDIVLLPGVNQDSKEMDGSVRYYGVWTVSIPATDSTPSVEGDIKIYQSFDFNEEGKILVLQSYGDWGGMSEYFEDALEGEEEDGEDMAEGEEME